MRAGPLIVPNLHAILIHYPLALVSIGTFIELFAFLWRRSMFRLAGRWMILIGALALAPAALSGLRAMAQVNRAPGTPDDATWSDVRASSPIQGAAWEQMRDHAWLNADACAILLFIVVIYLGSSDKWRRRLHWPFLILLLAGQGFLVAGAWHGGEMVYHQGISVQPIGQSAGPDAQAGSDEQAEAPAEASMKPTILSRLETAADPMDVHVVLAGLTISLALAALGLSMRAGAQPRILSRPRRPVAVAGAIGSALNPYARSYAQGQELDEIVDEPIPEPAATVLPSRLPVMRLWMLAFLLAVLTLLAGVWMLALGVGTWDWHHPSGSARQLWQMIADTSTAGGSRRLMHTLTGVAIVAILLILSIIGRWAATRQFILGCLALLLVVAVAAQVWFGSLLMFDTPSGPLGQFNAPTASVELQSGSSPAPSPAAAAPAPAPAVARPATSAPATAAN